MMIKKIHQLQVEEWEENQRIIHDRITRELHGDQIISTEEENLEYQRLQEERDALQAEVDALAENMQMDETVKENETPQPRNSPKKEKETNKKSPFLR